MWMIRPSIVMPVLLLPAFAGLDMGVRAYGGPTDQRIAPQRQTGLRSPSRPDEDREMYEKQVMQELERLLARLRLAPTEKEKHRLEQAIVDFVRGELRGTWLTVDFTLEAIDPRKNTIRVAISGTTLMIDGLSLAEDANIRIDGQEGRRAELRAGMGITLQLGGPEEQTRIVGIRARRGPTGPAAAEMDRLIRQLGSDKFVEREAASKALEALGKVAVPLLRQALASADAEVRSRAKCLLQALEQKDSTWYLSYSHDAPPNPGLVCRIQETNGKLYLINENGEQTEARVLLGRTQIEVIAFSWGGLKGLVEINKDRTIIKWHNQSKWTQKRP
jgi:hypothetical protein